MFSLTLRNIRNITPLRVRIAIGPFFSFFYYFYYSYIKSNPFQPHTLSIEETIQKIIQENLSAIRFGDGEISLITNANIPFQNKNKDLAEKMEKILQSNHSTLLICILNIWGGKIHELEKKTYWFELHHFFKYSRVWERLLHKDQLYGDAFITRPYLTIKDKTRSEAIFKNIQNIWKDKDVVLIEGEKARSGVGNNLFSTVKSIERILCPAENAYSSYQEILEEAKKLSREKLILLSLGPTAKVLGYELFLLGYRVIDIGHTDMEYDMFTLQSKKLVKVAHKYFNEIGERYPEDCTDKK